MEEGGWHSRIMGEFRQEDIENITYFVNVKDVVTADTSTLRQTGSFDNTEGETVIDIYFDDLRAVLPDTPRQQPPVLGRYIGTVQIADLYGIHLTDLTHCRNIRENIRRRKPGRQTIFCRCRGDRPPGAYH